MYYKIYKKACAILRRYKTGAILFFLSLMIICCRKEKLTDLESAISAKLSDRSMTSYIQKGAMTTFNGISYNYITSYVGVPVSLKSNARTNDTVIASVDTTLVAAYNQLYLETNPMIPPGAFSVSHNGAFAINNGSNQSKDSLYVTLKDGSQLKSNTTYLVPIRLQAKHGSELRYSLFFLKITLTKGQLTARMEKANSWGTASSFWRNSTMFITYVLASNQGVMVGPDSLRFGVTLNTAFNPSDVKIDATVTVDDSTINAYSKVFGRTVYKPWPTDTYDLRRSSATVKASYKNGADSLCLVIKNKQKFIRSTWYLLGLRIKRAGNNPLSVPSVASDSSRAFVAVFVQ